MFKFKLYFRKFKSIKRYLEVLKIEKNYFIDFQKTIISEKPLYSKFLKPGYYLFSQKEETILIKLNFMTIKNKMYLFKNSTNKNSDDIFSKSIKKIFNMLYSRSRVIKLNKSKDKKIFLGELIYLTADKKAYKIFDFDNLKVLTINNGSMNLNKLQKNPILQSENINTAIKRIDIDSGTVLEELILGRSFSELNPTQKLQSFKSIINHYIDYLNEENTIINKSTITEIFKFYDFDVNEIPRERFNEIESLLEIEFPVIKIHGDLHGKNIIYKNSLVTLIDLDKSNYNLFFIDIFFLIYSDDDLRKLLTDTRVNKLLSRYFSIVDLIYNPTFIYAYMFISYLIVNLNYSKRAGNFFSVSDLNFVK